MHSAAAIKPRVAAKPTSVASWRKKEKLKLPSMAPRDDITAIIARLPFLGETPDQAPPDTNRGSADDHGYLINAGNAGISRMESGELSPELKRATGKPDGGEVGEEASEDVIRRRLSVTNPFEGIEDGDDGWENAGDDPARSA